jgi:hypothetical protein
MMGRAFRGVCLICFCILGIAVVGAILEFAAVPILLEATGCHLTEVLPSPACGEDWASEGWARRSIEIVLNLPFLFFYALAFAFSKSEPPNKEFAFLLYSFDAILFFALIYPLLFFFARKSGRSGC